MMDRLSLVTERLKYLGVCFVLYLGKCRSQIASVVTADSELSKGFRSLRNRRDRWRELSMR